MYESEFLKLYIQMEIIDDYARKFMAKAGSEEVQYQPFGSAYDIPVPYAGIREL